jgi:hypothetical protein
VRLCLSVVTAVAFLAAACVPVVTHGPRVADGPSVGIVGALSTHPVLEREVKTGESTVTPVGPPMAVFGRYGWTPEAGAPLPFSVGVSIPLTLPFVVALPETDLYAQLTPTRFRTVAAGAGELASAVHVAPYAQAGYGWEDGVSVYTTQMVARFRGGDRAPDATVWMPAVAVKTRGVHLFAQAGLGSERLADGRTRRVRFGMGGVVVELRPNMWGFWPD